MQNNNQKTELNYNSNIPQEKSVFNTEAQKDLVEHSVKLTFKYMLYTFLVIIPFVLIIVFGFIYIMKNMIKF
jgi:hypothetical protein